MKKFIVLIATICMTFACMVVSASALELEGQNDPVNLEKDGLQLVSWVYQVNPNVNMAVLQALYVDSDYNGASPSFVYNTKTDSIEIESDNEEYYQRTVFFRNGSLAFEETTQGGKAPFSKDFFVSSMSSIYYKGTNDLWFEVIEEGDPHILASAVPSASLTGALSEVTSLLIWVIPAVIGLFAIRKGIAFLIARIRGV